MDKVAAIVSVEGAVGIVEGDTVVVRASVEGTVVVGDTVAARASVEGAVAAAVDSVAARAAEEDVTLIEVSYEIITMKPQNTSAPAVPLLVKSSALLLLPAMKL